MNRRDIWGAVGNRTLERARGPKVSSAGGVDLAIKRNGAHGVRKRNCKKRAQGWKKEKRALPGGDEKRHEAGNFPDIHSGGGRIFPRGQGREDRWRGGSVEGKSISGHRVNEGHAEIGEIDCHYWGGGKVPISGMAPKVPPKINVVVTKK